MSPANFESLPNEMLLEIVSLLPRDANASLSLVNHRLRGLTRAEVFSRLVLSPYGPLRSLLAGEGPHARKKLQFWSSANMRPLVRSALVGTEVAADDRWHQPPPSSTKYPQELQTLILSLLPQLQKLTTLSLSYLNLQLSDVAALVVTFLASVRVTHCVLDVDPYLHDLLRHQWDLESLVLDDVMCYSDTRFWISLLNPSILRTLHIPNDEWDIAVTFPRVDRLSIWFSDYIMVENIELMSKLPNITHLTISSENVAEFDEPNLALFRTRWPLPALRVLVLADLDALSMMPIFIPRSTAAPPPPYPHITTLTLTLACVFTDIPSYCAQLQQLPTLQFLRLRLITLEHEPVLEDELTPVDVFRQFVTLEIPLPSALLAFALHAGVGIHELSETPTQPSTFWSAFKSRCPGMADLWLVGDDFLIHSSAHEGCASYASEPVRQLRAEGQPVAEGDLGMYFTKRCSSEAELKAAQKELDEWWDRL
ncbi:hypothetical protein MKEN_00566700 [Mycena kentingensis (nom. inval.)]|nr:hypothetical protein MKEN_00566700 [Mycena kentingensis (nom. inval.)]